MTPFNGRKHFVSHALTVLVAAACWWGSSDLRAGQVNKASEERDKIKALIRALGDPAYSTRNAATLALCEIGAPAGEALQNAVHGDDTEVAFRAQQVLDLLNQIYFAGVTIKLSVSKSAVAWNEPVDLVITFHNESPYPSRLPIEISDDQVQQPTDARQVARLLDVAEWLSVTSDQGVEVPLHVDDYVGHADITKAIERRLEDGPSYVLAPHQSLVVIARAINRGWARYRLLEKGSYAFQIEYLPAWNNEQLIRHRVGLARSDEIKVSVTTSAPPAISRHDVEAAVTVHLDGQQGGQPAVTALIVNRHDRTMLVNTNLSPGGPPFARGEWLLETDGRSVHVPATSLKRNCPLGDVGALFQCHVVAVQPGESVVIGSVPLADIEHALAHEEAHSSPPARLRFRYGNLWDQHWIQRELRVQPIGSRQRAQWSSLLVGPRIISGRFDSPWLRWPSDR